LAALEGGNSRVPACHRGEIKRSIRGDISTKGKTGRASAWQGPLPEKRKNVCFPVHGKKKAVNFKRGSPLGGKRKKTQVLASHGRTPKGAARGKKRSIGLMTPSVRVRRGESAASAFKKGGSGTKWILAHGMGKNLPAGCHLILKKKVEEKEKKKEKGQVSPFLAQGTALITCRCSQL